MLSGANAFEISDIERMNIGAHQLGHHLFLETNKPDGYPLDEWQRMVLSETRGLWLSSVVRGEIGLHRRL
jgi:hypothetical protein